MVKLEVAIKIEQEDSFIIEFRQDKKLLRLKISFAEYPRQNFPNMFFQWWEIPELPEKPCILPGLNLNPLTGRQQCKPLRHLPSAKDAESSGRCQNGEINFFLSFIYLFFLLPRIN